MRPTRRRFLFGTAALLLSPNIAYATKEHAVIEGPAFGASWRVTLPASVDAGAIKQALEAIIASVDGTMSPFRTDSEITLFNNSPNTGWLNLSEATCDVLTEALHIARETGGAFDPTVGALVGRYGFGPITRQSKGNYTNITVENGAAKKDIPAMSIDLCGIAKGYALDRMAQALDAAGVANFLIELGGEVFARGHPSANRGWQVGIERPLPRQLSFQHLINLDGNALATSGDSVNSYILSGHRYSHIIDPHAGGPADTGLASVSVLAPTAIRADALATALFAMGPEAGAAFAHLEGISSLFLLRNETGLTETFTGTFADQILI